MLVGINQHWQSASFCLLYLGEELVLLLDCHLSAL